MRQKLQLLVALTAWLLASGSHWDLVQVYAWGKMFANYVPSMSIARAVELTLTPDNLCSLCDTVSEAKQQQNAALPSDFSQLFKKAPLIFQATPSVVLSAPASSAWLMLPARLLSIDPAAPPTPPPRSLA